MSAEKFENKISIIHSILRKSKNVEENLKKKSLNLST